MWFSSSLVVHVFYSLEQTGVNQWSGIAIRSIMRGVDDADFYREDR
jgi:hypothetical protein